MKQWKQRMQIPRWRLCTPYWTIELPLVAAHGRTCNLLDNDLCFTSGKHHACTLLHHSHDSVQRRRRRSMLMQVRYFSQLINIRGYLPLPLACASPFLFLSCLCCWFTSSTKVAGVLLCCHSVPVRQMYAVVDVLCKLR